MAFIQEDTTDLITAAMTTNAAISPVEHVKEELIATWVPSSFVKHFAPQPDFSYQGLALFLRPESMLGDDVYRGILEEPRDPMDSLTTFAEYIYADSF